MRAAKTLHADPPDVLVQEEAATGTEINSATIHNKWPHLQGRTGLCPYRAANLKSFLFEGLHKFRCHVSSASCSNLAVYYRTGAHVTAFSSQAYAGELFGASPINSQRGAREPVARECTHRAVSKFEGAYMITNVLSRTLPRRQGRRP